MAVFHLNGLPIGYTAIMLAIIASMGGFIFGYDTGQISDILLMPDFLQRFGQCGGAQSGSIGSATCSFSNVRSGLIVALLSIGTLVGALLGAPTADYLGRRWAMTTECIVFSIGVLVQVTAQQSWVQFAIGRLIAGFGVGALSAAVPMYQAETAPPQIRGTLTGTYQLFITFGILIAYSISIGARNHSGSASWRIVVGISFVWAVILGVGILTMPESPRWSVRHNNVEAARRAISRIRGLPLDDPIVEKELAEIVNDIEYEDRAIIAAVAESDPSFTPTNNGNGSDELINGEKHADNSLSKTRRLRNVEEVEAALSRIPWWKTWLVCFVGFKRGSIMTGYRTILGMSLQSLQQLTGANYFFYYGATIFQSVGIQDSYVTQIILGAVNFGCTFLGLYVMERYGRRRPLIIGGLWQSAWLFVFAAAGTAKNPIENQGIGKLMIVSACLFILGYASTWAPGIWILIGETFPTRTRAKQGALSTAANWLWNFLLAFFTPFIVSSIQYRYGFIFASCNLLGACVVYLFLYESAGLSLESVDQMYRDPDCRPWTSSRWAPVGYANRTDLLQQTQAAHAHKPLEAADREEVQREKV